ncbi:hypothetical protein FH972_022940 [Carpinus fangiana]|uniref:Uncharacterized protein n=1 Tax=Carpinus fangiana TaxID=176857 RepID=A0A5N6KVY8_9ROSI|nr:hypothetical protein FH972_022940 [Carpinus fangiana]
MEPIIGKKRAFEATLDLSSRADADDDNDNEPTELKLALLESLHPDLSLNTLLNALLTENGSVASASALLGPVRSMPREVPTTPLAAQTSPSKKPTFGRYQASIANYVGASGLLKSPSKSSTKKGRTLHLYTPESIVANTPCTLVPNFLPPDLADDLLRELLDESPTFTRDKFKLFDKVVTSPHTNAFYVDAEATRTGAYAMNFEDQTQDGSLGKGKQPENKSNEVSHSFYYNGAALPSVRTSTPVMATVSRIVQDRVNAEIQSWTTDHCPGGVKLKHQSPKEWRPNTAFVNCYDGGKESVGYHADQLSYLGPRAIIGSLSLGVEREFRVRRIIPKDLPTRANGSTEKRDKAVDEEHADAQGQMSIHLPHNSLLVMHASMQETFKHSIHPALTVSPHPIALNKRINITYRHYRDSFHPRHIPKCRCGIQCMLKCSMKGQGDNKGRHMWMCHTGYSEDAGKGCGFFEWAVFDEDGEPPWAAGFKGPA